MCELGAVVEKLDLQPGDLVVLTVRCRLTQESRERLIQDWERLGQGHRLVVLDDDVELRIIRDGADAGHNGLS